MGYFLVIHPWALTFPVPHCTVPRSKAVFILVPFKNRGNTKTINFWYLFCFLSFRSIEIEARRNGGPPGRSCFNLESSWNSGATRKNSFCELDDTTVRLESYYKLYWLHLRSDLFCSIFEVPVQSAAYRLFFAAPTFVPLLKVALVKTYSGIATGREAICSVDVLLPWSTVVQMNCSAATGIFGTFSVQKLNSKQYL